MISARQLKNILDTSFSTGDGTSAINLTATFIATPSTYVNTSIPSGVTLSGTISPNGGLLVTWVIKDTLGTTLTSGSGNTVSYNLTSIPTTIGSHPYTLIVSYQDSLGTTFTSSFITNVTVTTLMKVGQLLLPGDDLLVAGDLPNGVEATFTTYTNAQAINLFAVVADHVARLVIIVPNSYGTLSSISDNTDAIVYSTDPNVISEFKVIIDTVNNRRLYVSLNTKSPATYHYKLLF